MMKQLRLPKKIFPSWQQVGWWLLLLMQVLSLLILLFLFFANFKISYL